MEEEEEEKEEEERERRGRGERKEGGKQRKKGREEGLLHTSQTVSHQELAQREPRARKGLAGRTQHHSVPQLSCEQRQLEVVQALSWLPQTLPSWQPQLPPAKVQGTTKRG